MLQMVAQPVVRFTGAVTFFHMESNIIVLTKFSKLNDVILCVFTLSFSNPVYTLHSIHLDYNYLGDLNGVNLNV